MATAQQRQSARAEKFVEEAGRTAEQIADTGTQRAEHMTREGARMAEEMARRMSAWSRMDWRNGANLALRTNEMFFRSMANWYEEMARFAQARLQHNLEAGEALSRCRSASEAFEAHSRYARVATEQYAEEAAKLMSLITRAAQDSLESMQGLASGDGEEHGFQSRI